MESIDYGHRRLRYSIKGCHQTFLETEMTLNIQQRAVTDLIPYIANSRTHSDAQVAQIAASIKEFGWTNPILVSGDDSIIAGHGRLMAARKLGMEEVPVIVLIT
jgi:ParB-like chromosome segregation protein Spo0J